MVATTFAADTPLVVAGLVYSQGIAGNWIWWAFLLSGMMTVFFFARLWRRSGLMTDVQFAEMRYSGKPAAFLRGFRAIYLGVLMNCVILGWVTKRDDQHRLHHARPNDGQMGVARWIRKFSEPNLRAVVRRYGRPGAGHLHFLFNSVYRPVCFSWGIVRRPLDRSFSVCSEDGNCDCSGVLCCEGRGRTRANDRPRSQALRAKNGASDPLGVFSRFFARICQRSNVDSAGDHFHRVSRTFSGGHSGIRARSRGAADTSRSAFSAREASARAFSRCCGSISRITRCVPGRGFSPLSRRLFYIPASLIRNQVT